MAFRKRTEAKQMLEWYEGYFEIPPDVRKELIMTEKEIAAQEEKNGIDPSQSIFAKRKFSIFDDGGVDRNRLEFIPGQIQKLSGRAQRLREASNLGARFMNRTFASFDPKRNPVAFKQASDYANSEKLFGISRNCLLFVGGTGTGKTHLAAAIANNLVERGIQARFGTFQNHLDEIRKEFDQSGQKHYLDDIKGVPMLVIDDLGKERKTDWTQSILYDVINYRYEHMLPTVITTNLTTDELANHCEGAVWSRLNEMCDTILMVGKDNRVR